MSELSLESITLRAHPTSLGTNRAVAMHHRVRLAVVALGMGVLVGMSSGCAQVMALRQPAPLDRTLLAVGTDRTVVIGVLGAPVSAEDRTDGGRTEVYKYVDGGTKNSWWSKTGRVVVYTAGDIFTAWLDQIIWMPLELAFRGTEYASTVGFDRTGERLTVRSFEEIEAKTGKPVRSGGKPAPIASRSNSGDARAREELFVSILIADRSSGGLSIAGRWSRLPGLRIALAMLLASSGCATHGPRAPEVPHVPVLYGTPPPAGQGLLRTASSCPARIVVRAADSGQPLVRIEPMVEPAQLVPPKTLQSSYEAYLAKRGGDTTRDHSKEATGTATAPPPATAAHAPPTANLVAYSIPAGPRSLQVVEGSGYGLPGPIPMGGSGHHNEALLIIAAVGLLFIILMIADTLTREAPVILEVEIEAGKQYLLHCDAQKDPWAWVMPETVAP